MELAGGEDCLFTWEVDSNGYSNVDVEGCSTGSSGIWGRASRSFPKRSFWLFMVPFSIVAWGNLGGGMVACYKWLLLLQEVDEKMVGEMWKRQRQDCGKNEKKYEKIRSGKCESHHWNFQGIACTVPVVKEKKKTLIKLPKVNQIPQLFSVWDLYRLTLTLMWIRQIDFPVSLQYWISLFGW